MAHESLFENDSRPVVGIALLRHVLGDPTESLQTTVYPEIIGRSGVFGTYGEVGPFVPSDIESPRAVIWNLTNEEVVT